MTTRERTHGKQSRVSRDPIPLFFLSAVIVDDLLIFSKDLQTVIQPLKQIFKYTLKGVGVPGTRIL
jgi:hypothetical protein